MSEVSMGAGERWAFTIDTDSYAGNFECELGAYCMGETVEDGHGLEEAQLYRDEMGISPYVEGGPFFEKIEPRADDHGCFRPVSIFPTPGWVNDGVGHHYRIEDWEPEKVLVKYRQNKIDWAERYRHSYADKAHGNKEADQKIAAANALTVDDLHQFPAYNSVVIFFSEKPTDEQIRILKERAHKFVTERWGHTRLTSIGESDPAPKIEGFRLVCEITTIKEEPV
jgi:hypothetical protein